LRVLSSSAEAAVESIVAAAVAISAAESFVLFFTIELQLSIKLVGVEKACTDE
jgi:hypothetical protein